MKSSLIPALFALAALAFTKSLAVDPPSPLITKPGKVLLSEDFSAAQIPANWQPGGHPNSFSIVDGALQGVCSPEDAHGPAIGVPIDAHNVTIRFSVKLAKGLLLFLVDGDSQFGGQAHLLRVALDSKNATLQQDRGSLESKQAQAVDKQAAAKEGRKPATPTPEQLADPKFYRTETLDRKPVRVTDGEWHRVLVEISGNEAVAQVDDQVVPRANGPFSM